MYFEVIPTEIYREGGGALTYSSDQKLLPGHLVLVPLGKKTILGLVSARVAKVNFPTKPIIALVHPLPLPIHLLKAVSWLSKYYLSPLPACANLMLPLNLVGAREKKKLVATAETLSKIPNQSSNSNSIPEKSPHHPLKTHIPLNSAQKSALTQLKNTPSTTRLLRGVTGSGKTNIYLQLAAETLEQQKSVTLLVPEIALTSQLIKIFRETFGDRVLLIHSQQTIVERRTTWLRILEETNGPNPAPIIVIGPRSALLAPIGNLGLIIIDEAHEGAYYQENTPRYSALRLASFIASSLRIPCIEGTATPNITDYYLAKTHQSFIDLDQKAKTTATEPKITTIDLKDRANFTRNRYFSTALLTSITKNLQAKHQTLIFHNRRGSSPLTLCENCGWQALCPECYLPMILHADGYLLTCHICGHEEKVPASCPNCHRPDIIHKGFGTKLLETELSRLFPEAKMARFDGDNKKQDSLAALYDDVKSGQIDLLIGTQTLARGLDLPLLATVGVVQADAGLSLPDFNAEERTFELLNQVIGRVGRGHLDTAEVIIQTYQPEHPAIQTAIKSDYHAFAKYLLSKRHHSHLPPYTYLARLTITYKTEKTTLKKIQLAHSTLSKNPHLTLSPPMPAFHERTARGYTWQIIVKSTSREALREALLPFRQFQIELDPPSLL